MVAGSNWTATMQDGIRYSTRTLAVCSNAYLTSVFGEQEWQAAFAADPTGAARRLLPVRVEPCDRPGVLGQRVSVDLFALPADAAREALLRAVRDAIEGRAKPLAEPHFPGGAAMIPPSVPAAHSAPTFPGRSGGVATHPVTTAPVEAMSDASPPGSQVGGEPASTPKSVPVRGGVGSGECRALLIGIVGHEDEALPPRPALAPLLDAAAEALEAVGYRADVHDRSRLGASAVKSAIHSFLRGAGPDDTLLLVLAGHGVHHDGHDFLVPADADTGYQPFWDLCVPLDRSSAISRSPAGRVLVLVDAADDIDDALRATITEEGWSDGCLPAGGGTEHAYLIRRTRYPRAESPLLRALVDVLAERPAPADLPALQAALRRHLVRMAHGDPGASRGGPCELHLVQRCDPARFRPFPAAVGTGASVAADHPWCRVADRHAAWTLMAELPVNRPGRAATLREQVTVAAATADEMTLRERFVGYLLAVAHRMALEPSALPVVVVEHLGVADAVDLSELAETIRRAQWQKWGRSGRALSARCQHQAVQVALERHTADLDTLLAEAHRATGEIPALAALPTHATADAVQAVEIDGQPAYSSAGAQFRLAEDKVQELLMGEQLYAERGLAIRELYQNALDACRYRRAREEYLSRTTARPTDWTGRITFTQGFEPDGGAYHRMPRQRHRHGPARAHRRLRRVRHPCGGPARGHAGNGHLGRLRPADRVPPQQPLRRRRAVLLHDRRRDRGRHLPPRPRRPSRRPLPRHHRRPRQPVPRPEPRPRRGGGHHRAPAPEPRDRPARRLLRRPAAPHPLDRRVRHPGHRRCRPRHLARRRTRRLGPGGGYRSDVGTRPEMDLPPGPAGDGVWWANGLGAILADGLWVGRKAFGVVLNLTGALSPELSVDRNTIRELVDRTAVDDLLRAATPALVADESFGITRPWLNGFTYEFPIAADAVWQALRDRDGGVSLAGAAAAVPVDRIGYLPLDGELLPAPNPQLHSGLLYSLMSDALVHSRVLAWSGGAGAYGHDGGAPPAAVPSDLVIVGLDEDSGYPTPLFSALSWVAHIAGRMRRPFPYVRERLRALGLSMMSGKALTRSVITEDDLLVLSWEVDGRSPIIRSDLPVGQVLLAAQRLGRDPAQITRQLRALGLPVSPRGIEPRRVRPLDLVLLSRDLTGRGPWITWRVGAAHILRAALHTGLTVDEIRSRLAGYGYRVARPTAAVQQPSAAADADIFNVDDGTALQQSPVPHGFLVAAAARTNRTVAVVAARLAALGFPVAATRVRSAESSVRGPEGMTDGVGFRQIGVPIGRLSLLWVSRQRSVTPWAAARLLRELGFVVAESSQLSQDDVQGLFGGDESWTRRISYRQRLGVVDVLGLAAALSHTPGETSDLLARLGVVAPDLVTVGAKPEDAILFSPRLDNLVLTLGRSRGESLPVAQVLAAAVRLRRDPAKLADRVRELGVAVAEPAGWAATPLTADDLLLLAQDVDAQRPWLAEGAVSVSHLLCAAGVTGRAPAEIAARLAELGLAVEPAPSDEFDAAQDRVLVDLLDQATPRGDRPGPAAPGRAALLAAAHLSGRTPQDLARWLRDLGVRPTPSSEISTPRWDQDHDVAIHADDLDLLSANIDAEAPWLADGPVAFGHVLAAAGITGRRPVELVDRLRRLGFEVRGSGGERSEPTELPSVERVDAVDLVLLSRFLDAEAPWLAGGDRLPLAHLLHAACVLGCEMREVRERFARLGFAVPARAREIGTDERAAITVAFHRADTAELGDRPISVATVLGVAEFGDRHPAEVATLLTGLDLQVEGGLIAYAENASHPIPARVEKQYSIFFARRSDRVSSSVSTPRAVNGLSAWDALMLSARLDGCGPWLGSGQVPLAHVMGAAGYLRWNPDLVVARLAALGCEVPTLTRVARTTLVDGVDSALVDMLRDGPEGPLVDRPYSRAEILAASWIYRWTPRRIVDRLTELGFAAPDRDTFDR